MYLPGAATILGLRARNAFEISRANAEEKRSIEMINYLDVIETLKVIHLTIIPYENSPVLLQKKKELINVK